MNSEEIFNNVKNNTRVNVSKHFDPQEVLKSIGLDKTQDMDNSVADQKAGPQYIDTDNVVPEQKFVAPKQRSYYVAGNVANNEINTTAQRPNEIEYEADTIDDDKKKDNYFGLTKLATNKKDIVKNALKYVVQAPNLIQNASNTIGAITGKSGEDIAKEGVRGFAGSSIDFASAMTRFFGQNYMYLKGMKGELLDNVANVGSKLTGGEDYSDEIQQRYRDFYSRIDEQTKELKDKTERFLEYSGIAKNDKDGFVYDLVGGGASLLYAIGATVITKSPAAAAEVFGAYQYQSLYEEAIENGFNPLSARLIGVAGGTFEGLLEGFGLHVLIEGLVARKGFTKILKSAATELIQEASQQGAEESLAALTGMRKESLGQILFNVGYAGVIGALIGGGAAGISNTRFVQKMISDSAVKELINIGVSDEYAKQMVNNMLNFSVSPQVADELNNMLKDEQSPVTYKNADPRETYKEFGDTVKKALDPAQKRGVELELIQANKKLTQERANVLLNSGKAKNSDEAYRMAEQQTAMYDVLAREAYNQEGIRPEDYYKRFHVNAQSGNIEIDERNVDEDNPFVDVSFDPVDFDPEARAEYEAAMDAEQDYMDSVQQENKTTLKKEARILGDMGIGAIRRPTADGYGKERWSEYKDLSPRIKNYFFTDTETAMKWDEAEDLLAKSDSSIKDLFEYLAAIDNRSATLNQPDVFGKVLAKEKEAIKQQAVADGTFLKAPNGKDSNLPEQLWLTVRTKAFKNWFGDWLNDPQNASKVVDENGEPLVVYHGTKADFSVFEGQRIANTSEGAGFYFTPNKNLAQGFGNVKAVFLNIRNPQYAYGNIDLVSDTYEEDYEKENKEAIDKGLQEVKKKLEKKGYKFYKQVQKDLFDVIGTQTQEVLDGLLYLRNFVENENFDEEKIYNDIREAEKEVFKIDGYTTNRYGGDQKVYVVFTSNQIKSINNRGSFDRRNPDIYYQPDITKSKAEQFNTLQEEQYFANIIQEYNPNIKGDELYEDAKGVQLTFDFEQQANRETVESDVDKNITDDVTQQETLTTVGNGASYAIWRNGKTGNRLDKLDSVSDIRRIKDSFVGLSITETLIHNGQFSLEGKVVHNPYELAVAAQVLRNPRFETIHAVFVKNDEIVYHFAATTRLAGATQFDIKGMDDLISKTDCDGFYLIHNHPNGDPKPSFADTIFTQQLAKRYGSKFKQHVVIDHNRYRTIDKDGVMSDTDLIIDSTKRDNLLKTSKKHKGLYKKIDPETLPMFAVDLQYGDGKSVVVYVTNKLQAKAIQVVDNSIFDDIDTALEYLSKSGDYAGSGRMFVITDSADVNKQAKFIRKEYTREDKLTGILDVVYSKTKLNKDMVDNEQYETAYDIDRGYFSGRYNNKFFGERKYLYSGRLQNKKSLLKPTFDRGKLIENLSTDILSINPATSYSSLQKLVTAIENFINEKNSKAKDGYKKEINSIYKKENIDKNKTDKVIDRYTELFQQLNDRRGVVLREDATNYFQDNEQEQPRGSITSFDRQYWIDLFSGSDKSTLLHEGSHGWLSEVLYFANGKNPSPKILAIKKQLDNWLGEPEDNGRYSTRQQELFAGASETYFMEGKAPTPKLKTVFERFKKWLTDIYDAIRNDLPKINDDVRELFDTILSRSYDVPDSNIYAGKESAIKEVIKNINEGRASEVDGITIDDVYNLLNVAYMRKPSKPSKNLKQLLNDKNIYDFNELNKAGADTVLQILKDGGYVKEDATAEAAVELAKAALDGNPVYRLSDQWRVAGDIDFARNLRVLEKVIEFSQIDSVMEKILTLQEEGYRNVEQGDVEQVKDEYKRLMSADVKEAKKIVEDIINRLHKKRFIDRAAQKQMIVDLNFSSTVEEIKESVLNVIEDLQDEIKLVKEQLRNPRKPIVRKDKTIPPGKNATEEEKNNYKKYMRKQINRLLKQVLPSKQNNNKVSKFGNIEIQRFFEELIRINKMSREEAERFAMDRIAKDNEWILKDEKGEGFENKQKIINMFVSYKSKIITQNSPELLKELYDNLQKINIAGRNEKQINDYLTKAKRNKDMDELLDNIEKNGSKNKVSNWIKTFYNYAVANWYSCINSIAGEKQAEKDALELYEKNASVKAKAVQDRIVKRTCDVLGLKTRSQFDKKIHDYLKEKYEFIQNKIDHNGKEVQRKQTLNKMELICCYIWAKNKQLKERIIRAYGNEQFNEMMAKLDKYDMSWGDIIQEETASLYDDVNKVYVKMYGLDLPQTESYFPSSTERIQGNMDLLKDVIIQTSSPSFFKGRVDSNLIIMKFGNPINIAFNHIFKASRFAVMQEKLADIYKTYLHPDVSDKLKDIYGSDKIFNYIKKMLDNVKFENFTAQVDIVNSIFDHLANTYVITRIAGKPSIMIKQLLSFTNYMEDVDSTLWLKHFGKMIANPSKFKQIKEFMYEHSPYLKQRYESGSQNEALEKAMEGQANALLRIKSFKGFLSIMTRVGDIGAIIFGGYPMIQAQLEKGVPIEKAFENFEKATLRSQQANFSSTLSNWQNYVKQNPLLRAIFAFANTPTQYTRKLVDVCYKMAHGDEKFIKGKGFKTLALYCIEQSFVYTAFTSLALLNGLVNGDWDDLKDDVWLSLFQVSNFLGIPILGQVYNQAVSMYVTGNFVQDKRVPIIDDMTDFFKAIKKAYDNGLGDMDVKDWIDTTDKLASITTGVPIKTLYNTWISSWADIINGDYGKGFVKLYGATESRANKIFDN